MDSQEVHSVLVSAKTKIEEQREELATVRLKMVEFANEADKWHWKWDRCWNRLIHARLLLRELKLMIDEKRNPPQF